MGDQWLPEAAYSRMGVDEWWVLEWHGDALQDAPHFQCMNSGVAKGEMAFGEDCRGH